MSSAVASGENRAELAIEAALNSPLLNNRDIRGAERILITLASSKNEKFMATLDEQMAITDYIESLIGDEADMCKVGVIFDDALEEELLVTVIAAGFEDSHLPFKYDSLGTKAASKAPLAPPVSADSKPPVVQPVQGNNTEIRKEETTPTTAVTPTIPSEPVNKGYTVGVNSVPEPPKDELVEPEKSNSEPPAKPTFENKPEPQEDPQILRRLVQDIINGRYSASELEKPAYLRQNVTLHQKPNLPEEAFIPIKLDKHKR
jgi:cell division protein FtsZ